MRTGECRPAVEAAGTDSWAISPTSSPPPGQASGAAFSWGANRRGGGERHPNRGGGAATVAGGGLRALHLGTIRHASLIAHRSERVSGRQLRAN